MSNSCTTCSGAGTLHDHAVTLYRNLSAELAKALRALRSGSAQTDAKGWADALRAHRKALQTVLDIQVHLLMDMSKEEKGENALDLEAARVEVQSRLDRIADASGDRGAAE